MGLIYTNISALDGSNTAIALSNLYELECSLEVLIEKRLAHISELAKAIIHDGGDPDIIKSIILSIRSEGNADSGNIISENQHTADAIFSKFSLIERLAIFKEAFGKISTDKKNFYRLFGNQSNFVLSENAAERIAYLKNSYNDIAYMQFSSLFASPRAAYFNSIVDVCESVYNDNCEFCILPVETTTDGKLLSFYEMIIKYNFKINAVYDLHGDVGYTRYALLGKKTSLLHSVPRSKARTHYFEFAVNEIENLSLDDLLCASNYCSLQLRRIDTLNITRNKNNANSYICPVFKIDGADMQTFLSFLAIDCPDYIPLGLYIQI